jgi:hypothetical protein
VWGSQSWLQAGLLAGFLLRANEKKPARTPARRQDCLPHSQYKRRATFLHPPTARRSLWIELHVLSDTRRHFVTDDLWYLECSNRERRLSMLSEMTQAEVELICNYRSSAEREPIIRQYAELTRLSLGRAEDALDLWSHLLEQHRTQ